MIRLSALAAVAVVAVTTTACDRTESLTLIPEVEVETSFESGLDGWFVDRATGSLGTGAIVSGEASEGDRYLELNLVGGNDQVWAERAFTLEPNTAYNVTIMAEVQVISGEAELVVGARSTDPDGSGFVSEGAVPGEWTRILSPQPVMTDAQGRAWVAFGVRGTGAPATVGIDVLGASFLRTGGSGGS